MRGSEASRAQHQVFDQATAGASGVTITAGAAGSLVASGTVFPLLPQHSARFYHASVNIVPDAAGVIELVAAYIYVTILDGSGNNVASSPQLAAANYAPGTLLGSEAGGNLANSDDPILEIAATMLATVNPGISGVGPPATVQVIGVADVTNKDGSNDHTVFMNLGALIAFLQLR
jgi:hypothetical protein